MIVHMSPAKTVRSYLWPSQVNQGNAKGTHAQASVGSSFTGARAEVHHFHGEVLLSEHISSSGTKEKLQFYFKTYEERHHIVAEMSFKALICKMLM